MNSITRLILHRVASGNVPLTPQVIEVLKEVSEDHTDQPLLTPNETAAPADESEREMPPTGSRLGFLSPTGRWVCRASCALLLATGTVVTAFAADSFDAANEAFARANTPQPPVVANWSWRGVNFTVSLPNLTVLYRSTSVAESHARAVGNAH